MDCSKDCIPKYSKLHHEIERLLPEVLKEIRSVKGSTLRQRHLLNWMPGSLRQSMEYLKEWEIEERTKKC